MRPMPLKENQFNSGKQNTVDIRINDRGRKLRHQRQNYKKYLWVCLSVLVIVPQVGIEKLMRKAKTLVTQYV